MHSIAKFNKISSVGKFRDYIATGDVSFKEFTLIYADNGSGKTTLASILRSLLTDNAAIIRKRLSNDHTIDQAVLLLVKDGLGANNTISFGKAGWKSQIKNIEIFDTFFVNQNIYSGFEISDEHKKNLHHFVVGAEGVAVKNKIIQNKTDKEFKKGELDRLCKAIILKVGYDLKENILNSFIKIKQADSLNIDVRISKATEVLKNSQAKKNILKFPELPTLNKWILPFDFEKLIADIESSSSTIQSEALEVLFHEHIKELTDYKVIDAEDWVRVGFDYVYNKTEKFDKAKHVELNCPFCKQELSPNLQIIKSYTQVFNDVFNNYVERLNTHYKKIQRTSIEVLIEAKRSNQRIFKERIEFWMDNVSLPKPAFRVLSDTEGFLQQFNSFKNTVQTKLRNPSTKVNSKPISEFKKAFNSVNSNIEILNKAIGLYNEEIKKFKANLKDPIVAEEELKALQRIKKRFDPQIIRLCSDYVTAFKENKQLEDDYTKLSKEEEEEANKFITTYGSKINYYLKDVFGTKFQIENMLHRSRKGKGKDVKVDYILQLNNKDISFDSQDPFSICDCLSEGDKSTIAFCFFLSKLELDPNISDKILVLDDPLSSLDSNRRHLTVDIICDLAKRIKQTIVLSHNETFLWELYKDFDASKRKALKINQDHLNDCSFIEELDIAYLVEHDYFKHIAELEAWLKKPIVNDKERIIGLIRNILESHIKFKFYRQLRGLASGSQTFGSCIDELEKKDVTFRSDERDQIFLILRKLNAISCRVHHGGTLPDPKLYGVDPSKISDSELAIYSKKMFRLIDVEL